MSNSSDNKKFMLLAMKKAEEGIKSRQSPFGSCIVKNGKVISCTHNHVWKNKDITAHAEVVAIREACKKLKTIDLSDCVIYSTCEPCPMCFSAIHWARISKIVFGTSIADANKTGFNELFISNLQMKKIGKSKVKVKGNYLKKECIELFNIWSKRKDKKSY